MDILLEHLGSAYGQHDFILKASADGVLMGRLEFSEYLGAPSVSWLEVGEPFRRRHVATTLLHSLQERYTGIMIDLGGLTDQGWEAISRMPCRYETNTVVVEAREEMETLQTALGRLQAHAEIVRDGTGRLEDFDFSQWNELADRLEELELLVASQPEQFRFFDAGGTCDVSLPATCSP